MPNAVILHRSFQNRVLIGSFDENTDKNPANRRVGIRSHGHLTSLFLRLLSVFRLASGIVSVKLNGSIVHLNKGSFDKWCTRHGVASTTQSAEAKIQSVLKIAFPSRPRQARDLSTSASAVGQRASATTAALREKASHNPTRPKTVRRRLFEKNDAAAAGVSAAQPQAAADAAATATTSKSPLTNAASDSRLEGAVDAITTTLPGASLVNAAESIDDALTLAERVREEKRRMGAQIVNQVALEHIEAMVERYYRPDGQPEGQLNNQWHRARLLENPWGMDKTPQQLREKADLLMIEASQGDLLNESEIQAKKDKAERTRKKADEREAWLEAELSKLPKSHFPIRLGDRSFSFEAFVEEQKRSARESIGLFYYGTTPEHADRIRQKGFDPYSGEGFLAMGGGVYLSDDRSIALNFADGKEKGVLTYRLKPGLKLALAHSLFIREHFRQMAVDYMCSQETAIKARFEELELPEEVDGWGILIFNLTHRFAAAFFQRLGYVGDGYRESNAAFVTYVYDPRNLDLLPEDSGAVAATGASPAAVGDNQ